MCQESKACCDLRRKNLLEQRQDRGEPARPVRRQEQHRLFHHQEADRGVPTEECHRPDLSDCPPAKRQRGNPTLRIGDLGPMGRLLIVGEPGTDFVPALAPLPGEHVIEKPGKGAFYRTNLMPLLHDLKIKQLLIAGVTTEVCVQTTMREANDRGFDCLMVEDATESYFAEFKAATLAMVRAQGAIVGWTAPTDNVIAAIGA